MISSLKVLLIKALMGLKNNSSQKYNMKNLISALLFVFSVNLIAQSPWVRQKKESYIQLAYTFRPTYNEVSGDPSYDTDREIADNTLQLYGEYGLSNKTTLLLGIPLKMVNSGDIINPTQIPTTQEDNVTSLGNINIGVKHNFIDKQWLFSGQLNLEANTGTFDENSGLRTGLDAWTFTPLLITGTSFNKWYLQGFTGVDIRTNDYSSSFKLGGEIGYKALNKMWVTGFLDSLFSFKNGDITIPTSNILTGLYLNNQNYTAFGLKLINEINNVIGVNLGVGGAFTAENIGKGPTFTFGFYYNK